MKDLDGVQFGFLTATNIVERRGKVYYRYCFCKCGNTIWAPTSKLTSKHTKSCGCYRKKYASIHGPNNKKSIVGQRFGRLLVISDLESSSGGNAIWNCVCDCGNYHIVTTSNLKLGKVQSCGCLAKETASKLLKSKIGSKNYNWNSELTELERVVNRNYDQYKKWRLAVYKRDGYKCVLCSSKKSIHAHHLYSYHQYNHLRTDLNNGITLCSNCHSRFHKKFGFINNTLEQFLSFKKELIHV